jgi:hypothetical protein
MPHASVNLPQALHCSSRCFASIGGEPAAAAYQACRNAGVSMLLHCIGKPSAGSVQSQVDGAVLPEPTTEQDLQYHHVFWERCL